MTEYVPIILELQEVEPPIVLNLIETESPIELYISEINSATYDIYTGEYTAIPKVVAQTFETKHKLMTDNFEVEQIPYAEVGNEYGTTVTIAS